MDLEYLEYGTRGKDFATSITNLLGATMQVRIFDVSAKYNWLCDAHGGRSKSRGSSCHLVRVCERLTTAPLHVT